jgi:hypothetical protein
MFAKKEDMIFGSLVHDATARMDTGKQKICDFIEPLRSRVLAWEKFKQDFGLSFKKEVIEQKEYNMIYGYAGTPDRVGKILVEIKTGPLNESAGMQLAGYANTYNLKRKEKAFKLLGVSLRSDGSYRAAKFDYSEHFNKFLECLKEWRQENDKNESHKN